MAELVDAHGSGPCTERCGGSSPLQGTTLRPLGYAWLKPRGDQRMQRVRRSSQSVDGLVEEIDDVHHMAFVFV